MGIRKSEARGQFFWGFKKNLILGGAKGPGIFFVIACIDTYRYNRFKNTVNLILEWHVRFTTAPDQD